LGPDWRKAKVIGVVANHHQVSFKEGVNPVMYTQPDWTDWKYFSVIVQGDLQGSIRDLEAAYAKAFPGNPFSWFFLDDFFDQQYKEDQQFGRIFNVFTWLAIIVTTWDYSGSRSSP